MVNHDEDALIRLMFDLRQVWRGDWGGAVLVVLHGRSKIDDHGVSPRMVKGRCM